MQTSSPSLSEESGPLPQFEDAISADDLEDLIDAEEREELTIRRVFAPRKPPRVAVEISDADKTWKWDRPVADAKGQFVALDLPTLEEERALEFDHSEAEVTREMASPFALTPAAAAIPLAAARRRRPRMVAAPRAKQPSFIKTGYGRAALIAVAGVVAFFVAFAVGRRTNNNNLGVSAGAAQLKTAIDLPPIADVPLHGTIVPSVKGHRLYVDGKLLGDSDGPVVVECGTRIIKLGTAGYSKSIAVPCGGEIAVTP